MPGAYPEEWMDGISESVWSYASVEIKLLIL